MAFIKTFESFSSFSNSRIYVANPEADDALVSSGLMESLKDVDGFYEGNIEETVEFLESTGFSSPFDFVLASSSLNEALKVKYQGHEVGEDGEVEIFVDINGHKYGYKGKSGDLDIADIARKFEKMLMFSAGRALSWLKKHTTLSSGSKSTEATDLKTVKEGKEHHEEAEKEAPIEPMETPETTGSNDSADMDHYMFFQNLKTIKNHIDMMMEMDPHEVDELIKNGHDWAEDHIATSKDDIEEVCNWLCNSLKG